MSSNKKDNIVVATKWENEDKSVQNPVRNTGQDYLKFVNTSYFNEEARKFLEWGYYTNAPVGTIENKEYWREQKRRCLEGYTVGGVRIPGRYYFFLNFGQMHARGYDYQTGKEEGRKRITFPRFLDHQYYLSREIEKCMKEGLYENDDSIKRQGLIIAKARRKGITYDVGNSLLSYNYNFLPASKNFIGAYEKEHYRTTLDGVHLSLNHINKNTYWKKRRQAVDRRDHFRASVLVKDSSGVQYEDGYMSEVKAVSFKDSSFKSIGSSADLFCFEEAGRFPDLLTTYRVTEPLWRDGNIIVGFPIIYGCVCAGTKVWTNEGNLINIEDINKKDGILGFDNNKTVRQNISHINLPAKKPCYRITTTGGYLECSEDHPILWSKKTSRYSYRETINGKRHIKKLYKRVLYKEVRNIKEGDQVAVSNSIPFFGDKKLWEPRLIGMLIGDGSYGWDKTPRLFNADKEINDYIENKFDCLVESERGTKDGRLYKETRIRGIISYLRDMGIYEQTKSAKRLPNNIYKCDKYSVTELLAGLIDTDGYVCCNGINKSVVNISAANYKLLEETKYLFHKIGVYPLINYIKPYKRKKERRIKDKNGYYRLSIVGKENLVNLSNNIKLLVGYKQEALENIHRMYENVSWDFPIAFTQRNKDNNKYVDVIDVKNIRLEKVKKIEYIGWKFIYNLMANDTHTYIANGFITHNTGGDIDKGAVDFSSMFYSPKSYGLKAYDNIYDDRITGECGYFIDSMWYYPGKIKKQVFMNEAYRDKEFDMVDKQGNSVRDLAEEALDEERGEAKTGDQLAYQKLITQYPKTPREAFLRPEGSPFPVKELSDHEANLRSDPKKWIGEERRGSLVYEPEGGGYKFEIDENLFPINKYPLDPKESKEGALVIWEMPQKNEDGNVPSNLYIAGCDPYDNDVSTTNSLGSTFIMNYLTGRIVAEYTGRPKTAKGFYETTLRMLEFYNATLLYENNKKGIFSYFEYKNRLYLLADTPNYLQDKEYIKYRPVGNDSKGVKIQGSAQGNKSLISHAAGLYKQYLLEEAYSQNSEGHRLLNLHTIKSIPLIQETVFWNFDDYSSKKRNYDRMSSIWQLMIYRESLVSSHVGVEEKKEKLDPFFANMDLFKLNEGSSMLWDS